ncbi:MAG: hypothetical protein HY260_16055 [Chloroflexi bacterium]|nr:hypothetical protein [Chloroflexota bacterium]
MLLLSACATLGQPSPALVEGDPWDYNLSLKDLPKDFQQEYLNLESGVITNRDVALTANDTALFGRLNGEGRELGHFVEFTGGPPDGYNHVSALVVVYRTVEGAVSGQAESLPGFDPDITWQEVSGAEKIGDESRVLEMLVPGEEVVYRVDFRYRNAKASVGVGGKPDNVPSARPAIDLAKAILSRMRAAPVPNPLAALKQARLSDIRELTLNQEDLIQLDPINGVVWYYDDNPLPQWTPEKEGVVAGYQISFYRPTAKVDVTSRQPYSMIVSLLAYPSEAGAKGAMAGATGPPNAQPAPLDPIGQESAGWYHSGAVNFFGTTEFQSTYEINFRVGAYVAGVRVLAFEPKGVDPLAPNPAIAFLHTFAQRQA